MSSVSPDFDRIFTEFRPKIHRFLLGMVGANEAEDLTQEVFIRVNKALDSFRGDCALSTWVYRIAANVALDRLRSPSFRMINQHAPPAHAGESGETEVGDANPDITDKAPSVEQQVYRKEMSDCVLGFVNSLPETFRTVLVLSEFENLTNQEIAAILGITLDTVKIRLYRARGKLKLMLANSCGSEWVEGNPFLPELSTKYLDLLKE